MEDHRSLDQQGIDQEDRRIDDQAIQQDLFDQFTSNDLPDKIAIERNVEYRDQIDKDQVIDLIGVHDSGDRLRDEVDQEEQGKRLQIPGALPAPKNGQACQESDGCKNGRKIK